MRWWFGGGRRGSPRNSCCNLLLVCCVTHPGDRPRGLWRVQGVGDAQRGQRQRCWCWRRQGRRRGLAQQRRRPEKQPPQRPSAPQQHVLPQGRGAPAGRRAARTPGRRRERQPSFASRKELVFTGRAMEETQWKKVRLEARIWGLSPSRCGCCAQRRGQRRWSACILLSYRLLARTASSRWPPRPLSSPRMQDFVS